MKKLSNFIYPAALTLILVFLYQGCDSSTDPTTNNTVKGTLTLPVAADGKEWFVLIDTDRNGEQYVALVEGTCGTGTTVNYSFSNIAAGTYYIYAVVRITSAHGTPPDDADYMGIYGGTLNSPPANPNAEITSEGTMVFNITLSTTNTPPTINSLTAEPNRLAYGDNSNLTVVATDVENDDLTYQWSSDYGSFVGSTTSNLATWQAPNSVGNYVVDVEVSDGYGTKTAGVDIEVMGLFFDEFSTNLSAWEESYSNSWISSEEAHIEGDVSGFYGTLSHPFNTAVEPEYTVRMQLARVDNFSSDEYYGLYTRVDDTGETTVTSWWFIIEPSKSGENWALICWLSSSSGSGWYLLDQNSLGESSLISTSAGTWNDVSWTIENDKTVIVKIDNQLLYQSDEILNLENTFNMTITMDLVRAGCRTFYQKEIKMDEALVSTPSQPSAPFIGKKDLTRGFNQHLEQNSEVSMFPRDISKLKTLREALNDLY